MSILSPLWTTFSVKQLLFGFNCEPVVFVYKRGSNFDVKYWKHTLTFGNTAALQTIAAVISFVHYAMTTASADFFI